MVDIARSLGMSHANVYRFFRSKSEILDAIVDDWLSKLESLVEIITQRPGSAAARLEAVVVELHQIRRRKCVEDPEIFVAYRRVMDVRPDSVVRRKKMLLNVFKRLIDEGVRAGEFLPVDGLEAATLVEDATALFLHPLMNPTAAGAQADARARNVVRHLLKGLATSGRTKRNGTSAGPPGRLPNKNPRRALSLIRPKRRS